MNKIYPPAIFLLFLLLSCKKEAPPQPKPLEILVTTVLQQDVKIESEYTGQTFGQSDIQINPRVDGLIESINFKEGSFVSKGQLLYTIDPLPYRAKLNEAEGGAAESQARLSKTKSDLDMITPLAKMNAVSQRELVSAKSAYTASIAQIKASDASVQNAKIELGYCRIVAPISGLIGISKVRVGDYVRPGPTSILNTISDLGDVRVRFTMSEQEFLRLFREYNKPDSALKSSGASVSLKLSDGSTYPQTGKVSFTDRQIDPATGAITFEAAFPNPDKLLRPGQYAKIALLTDIRKDVIVIPQRAVIEVQGIYQVYVLGNDNKVQMKIVKPGPAVKNGYIIEEGLKPGDKIAMGGTSLLKNGSVITPKVTQWQLGETETAVTK
ncbi:efflux RND transporter periplasmic adaptor subunit [Flavobacterium sp. 245]|uniref:efflux RND transporter periplasmic adaptor subunit n=1 Tax=Flavobacterium sp. 245 TaxID=2512115 RepID=UPI00105F904F|nr:efflux RND transporter periplasmic adaptor subunit [Flavobacterium sp. 245]TDO93969.1 membrane fusion protein (multidrug efflux system) [Flavobacterium sp. 245]